MGPNPSFYTGTGFQFLGGTFMPQKIGLEVSVIGYKKAKKHRGRY